MVDLSELAQLPAIAKFIERCIVDTVPAGAVPKDVTIQLPDGDGAKVPARYTGFPPGLVATDEVSVRVTPQDSIKYIIAGSSGATAKGDGWPFNNIRSVDPANIFADYANLPDAVTNATAGDVIILNPGTYTLSAILDIDKSLTIDGIDADKVTIQYSGADHTIDINAANITLKNLTVINTSATANTSPVLANGTDFVIENCILTSSGHAASNGIYSLGSSGKVIESTVTASGASSVGIKDASATFTVSVIHCTVTGVNADISLSVSGSSVEIQDSTMGKGRINTVLGTLTGTFNGAILVNNASGALPDRGDVGYLDESGDYKETTTEGANIAWCVVEIGNIDGKNIFVRRQRETTVNYTGAAPNAGDFLITSTVAGLALTSGTMRPEIFAVCTANGAGGTVAVQLLTGTVFVPKTSASNIARQDNTNSSDFDALINAGGVGGLTVDNVPYDNITAGNENTINAIGLGNLVLHNTTRSNSRLIASVDQANNKITTIASTDDWADNDVITAVSKTCFNGTTIDWFDVDLSQQTDIPPLARALRALASKKDTGAVGKSIILHPFQTLSGAKQKPVVNFDTTNFNYGDRSTSLFEQKFCMLFSASGAGTQSYICRLQGYYLAVP